MSDRLVEENFLTTHLLFAALDMGDVEEFLGVHAEDVEFLPPVLGASSSQPSWLRPRRGRAEIARFLSDLQERVELHEAAPTEVSATAISVSARGQCCGVLLSSGSPFECEWDLVLSFRDGKITRHKLLFDRFLTMDPNELLSPPKELLDSSANI